VAEVALDAKVSGLKISNLNTPLICWYREYMENRNNMEASSTKRCKTSSMMKETHGFKKV
jgi:hypothetical protein